MGDDTKAIISLFVVFGLLVIFGFSAVMFNDHCSYKKTMELAKAGYYIDRDGVVKKIEAK